MSVALRTLGFLEFPEEDVPPEWMWHHDEQINEWFKAVAWRRQHPNERPLDDDDEGVRINRAVPKSMRPAKGR